MNGNPKRGSGIQQGDMIDFFIPSYKRESIVSRMKS
jgi:hypothetical protein